MANRQIADYVKSQLKLGIGLEAIKDALIGAGWAAADVEDSIRSIDALLPTSAGSAPAPSPRIISVNDLIPNSGLGSVSAAAAEENKQKKAEEKKETKPKQTVAPAASVPKEQQIVPAAAVTAGVSSARRKTSAWMIVAIVCGVLALGGGGASAYFYSQIKGLQDKLTMLTSSGDTASSKVADLTAQLNDVAKAKEQLMAQVTTLTSENQDLNASLSFFVTPSAADSSTPQALSVNAKGTLSGGALYSLTLSNGIKLFISNSKDAKIAAVLKPLLGALIEIAGSHNQGSNLVNITSVNGNSVQ